MEHKKKFDKLRRQFKRNHPMCYITSNKIFQDMTDSRKASMSSGRKRCCKFTHDMILKKSVNYLYKLTPSITSIEINIASCRKSDGDRKKYNIANKFWVPRIFNHAFNVLILDNRVIIAQSWFRVMNYQIIYTLTHGQFIKWLDKLRYLVKNYNKSPKKLFAFFKFPPHKIDSDLKNMFKYANDSKNIKISFLANYSFFNGVCKIKS